MHFAKIGPSLVNVDHIRRITDVGSGVTRVEFGAPWPAADLTLFLTAAEAAALNALLVAGGHIMAPAPT